MKNNPKSIIKIGEKMYFLGVAAFYEADLSPLMHINVMQAGVYKVHGVMYMSGRPHGSKPL